MAHAINTTSLRMTNLLNDMDYSIALRGNIEQYIEANRNARNKRLKTARLVYEFVLLRTFHLVALRQGDSPTRSAW